jgi:uncharacterized hydrophobic protein (TIGR00271 family)
VSGKPVQRSWLNRATVTGAVLVVLALIGLAWPEISARAATLIVGLGLVAVVVIHVVFSMRSGGASFNWTSIAMLVVTCGSGLALIAVPQESLTLAARLVGAVAILAGVRSVAAGIREFRADRWHHAASVQNAVSARNAAEIEEQLAGESWPLPVIRGALLTAGGTALVLLPEPSIRFAFATLAIVLLALGLVLISYGLQLHTDEELTELDSARVSEMVRAWFEDKDIGRDRRDGISDSLYYEEPDRVGKLTSFGVMMLLSTTIAALGILQDSTAVVIGAMLIAPLMTPIMGIASGIVGGWPRRTLDSAATVTVAAAGAIGFAWIVAAWVPAFGDLTANSQVTSRTVPTLVDLLIGVAAGAAGAYATVDRRVSSSLPGVAIAVALVPPLAVTGVTAHARLWDEAGGALLLFVTNGVAIVLSAVVVFVITGFVSIRRLHTYGTQIKASLATVLVSALVIVVPLGITGQGVIATSVATGSAEDAVATWLAEEPTIQVLEVKVEGSEVGVVLASPDSYPPIEELEDLLSAALETSVIVTVNQVPTLSETYSDADGGTVSTPAPADGS